jgi:excinuclease ABC subunit C
MVQEAQRVSFKKTDSVLEALLLEAECIKILHPRYNTRDKDDKSFLHILVTMHEAFPRFLTVRGKDLPHLLATLAVPEGKTLPVFGPFPHGKQLKDALVLIRKIFPFFDTREPVATLRERNDRTLRFNEALGAYPARFVSSREYARTVRHLLLFLSGKKERVRKMLERAMYASVRKQEFEKAEHYKRQIFALQHIEDVSLVSREQVDDLVRIEGYDVAHLGGEAMKGVMTVVVGDLPDTREYRSFSIRSVQKSNDTQALREVLERRLTHTEWRFPRLVVVDGGIAQKRVAEGVLARAGIEIPVVAVVKDEHHRPKGMLGVPEIKERYARGILLANAEAHRFSLAMHRRSLRKGRVVRKKA